MIRVNKQSLSIDASLKIDHRNTFTLFCSIRKFVSPMAQFVGLSVLVILREPSAKVRGLVTAVVEQRLTLDQGATPFSVQTCVRPTSTDI